MQYGGGGGEHWESLPQVVNWLIYPESSWCCSWRRLFQRDSVDHESPHWHRDTSCLLLETLALAHWNLLRRLHWRCWTRSYHWHCTLEDVNMGDFGYFNCIQDLWRFLLFSKIFGKIEWGRQEAATKMLLFFILFVAWVLLGPWGLLNLILNKYKTQGGNLPSVTWRPPTALSEISLVWHLPWGNFQAETQNQSRILCEASSRKILSSFFAHAIISIKTGT